MSKIIATVNSIENIDNLNIVKFTYFNTTLSMMSLDLSSNIKVGTKVLLVTKPTHIALAKNFLGELSYSNQIETKILDITNGKLLSKIILKLEDTTIESIITVESSKEMNLQKDDNVTAIINPSELSILKVLNND